MILDAIGDRLEIRHLLKHRTQEKFIDDAMRYVGLNKSYETLIKYATENTSPQLAINKLINTFEQVTGTKYQSTTNDTDQNTSREIDPIKETTEKYMAQVVSMITSRVQDNIMDKLHQSMCSDGGNSSKFSNTSVDLSNRDISNSKIEGD